MAQPPAAAPAAPAAPLPRPHFHVTPEKFSGRLSDNFASWVTHFQQVSAVNQWTPQEQVLFLGLSLDGEAQLYYQSLPVATRQGNFPPLLAALQARFAPPQRVDLHRASFQSRRQRKDETLGAFCEDVRSLGRLAYPQMAAPDVDSLVKDQFISGLDSRTMRVRVRELNPATTDAALQAALHHQAIQAAEGTRDAEATTTPAIPAYAATPDVSSQLDTMLRRLEAMEARLAREPASNRPPPGRPPQWHPPTSQQATGCWNCGRPGHYARDCRAPRNSGNMRRQRY